MKSFVVFALLAAAALAAPPHAQYSGNDKDAVVEQLVNDNIGVEGYNLAYETSNGIKAEAEGKLLKVGNEGAEAVAVRGSYSYPGPDGVVYTVTYTADENGYHAEGAHLPK